MKWFLRRVSVAAATCVVGVTFLYAAGLGSWAENTRAGTAIEAALFRLMNLPGGSVLAARPPEEAIEQVSALVKQSPEKSELYAIRAQEEERRLDESAAENDWKKAAELASDKATGLVDLAEYYHRRLEPQREIDALLDAGKVAAAGLDRYQPDTAQSAWRCFERALRVYDEAALPAEVRDRIYQAWMERYPKSRAPYKEYLAALTQGKAQDAGRALQARMRAQFPDDVELQIETEAQLASIAGGPNAELDVYGKRFNPLWPTELRTHYYELLKGAHQLRAYLADAREAAAKDPGALDPRLRIYFYFEQEGKRDAADDELVAWRSRRDAVNQPLNAGDLATVGPLFQRIGDYDEAARSWYSLHELGSATPANREESLSALISLLLDVPEQPLHFGKRDLSLYSNIAQMDRHPGFLNGILSLALNTTFPQSEYQNASQSAVTYFHRASASKLLERMKQEFPQSARISALDAKLFGVYAAYGQNDALIRLVPAWLDRNSDSSEYVNTALALGDAYSTAKRTTDEFALYDKLLGTLAAKSDRVPLGPTLTGKNPTPRSAEYARVLDRYISRLTAAKRLTDAIALYRREIDRNPDDPGLYQRLALFIEQNRLDEQLAQTFRAAFDRFRETTWADKLGRLYLRRKQYVAYQALAREITDKFEGTELADFVRSVEPNPKLNPVLYRQINLYAHRKFPHNLLFVRNLLAAYQTKGTADPGAYEKLLRANWFYDGGLRATFFEFLSRTGQLMAELGRLPNAEAAAKQKNVAALQELADGRAWLTEFESGAGAFVQLARLAPGDRVTNARAIAVERSLVPSVKGTFETAISLAEQDVQAAPRDSAAVTRVGEIYADRDLYFKATPWWNRVAAIDPGSSEGYREAATVFWDYFRYDDALRLIDESRRALGPEARFAYEAGAIYENKNDFERAIDEYTKAALEQPRTGENASAEGRLITLAKRKNTATLVERRTADLMSRPFRSEALQLRIAILESQNRRDAIGELLLAQIPRVVGVSEAEEIKETADHFGFDNTGALALERVIALTNDPAEKIKARADLASFRENHGDLPGAERDFDALLRENPNLLGVIRLKVDFAWRNKRYEKAVSTLVAASSRAQQPYQNQLRREAAQKAADSGEYETARQLLDELLSADPYNGDYLAQKVATYSRAGDNQGLVSFYTGALKTVESSSLNGQDKADRIAALRRGYIAALITTKNFREALEQYEQVLNQFPEDNDLAREAARFAEKQNLSDLLIGYYSKAVSDSPRNYRWPLLLARINTALGRYSDAVIAYDKAAYVRPDRTDILIAKADLQVRLLEFADAIKTNQKLYDLSYHDSRYLDEQAALNARLGNKPEAVRLLRAGHIDLHAKEPAGYVEAMRQLIAWHMFSEAQSIYGELRPLLTDGSEWAGEAVALDAQVLASLHRPAEAMAAVTEAWSGVKGLNADTNKSRYSIAIGAAAREYLTPDERPKFAELISRRSGVAAPLDAYELANAAGLLDVAADALTQKLHRKSGYEWNNLRQMQSSRLEYKTLGRELESLARVAKEESMRDQLLRAAVDAYAKAGDAEAQLRIAGSVAGRGRQVIDTWQYASLFVAAHPDLSPGLTALAKQNSKYADAVVQNVVSNRPMPEALNAIQARGSLLSTSWTKSYSALAGLYELSPDPIVARSFEAVLGSRTVGGELANLRAPVGEMLRGIPWFYYAARYGEYLGYRYEPSAAELLPASLEASPAASNSYLQLGDAYRDLKQLPKALARYGDALQLSPGRTDVLDRMAVAQARAGERKAAIENWRKTFRLMADRVEAGPLSPDYWTTAENLLSHVNRFRAIDELRTDAEAMLRAYLKRNGAYNFNPFINGILQNAPDANRAIDWIMQLARESDNEAIITGALDSPLIEADKKAPLYRFALERATTRLSAAAGDAREAARDQLLQLQTRFIEYLLLQSNAAEAWRVLGQIEPPGSRPVNLALKAAALSGHLEEVLAEYRSAPPGEQILGAASELETERHSAAALLLKEFEYQREVDAGQASAAAYFGLAQVRIAQKRAPEAERLIGTVALSVGAPFENLPEAVRVLETAGLNTSAATYAQQWKTAEPWNAEAQMTCARLQGDAAALDTVRKSAAVSYQARTQAAAQMRLLQQTVQGADELSLLTRQSISPAEARKPFFVAARLAAAGQTRNGKERVELLREAIAIDPSMLVPRLALADVALRERQVALGIAALESYASPNAYMPSTPARQLESLGPPELARVQLLAAEQLMARKDFSAAIGYYDLALTNFDKGPQRVRIQKLREAAQTQATLAALNAGRQPVVTDEVMQAVIVKPKLTILPPEGNE